MLRPLFKRTLFKLDKLAQLVPFKRKGLAFIIFTLFSASYFSWIFLSLPKISAITDYKPSLLTEIFDRNQNKIGEFFKQRRLLFNYEDMPSHVINAFVAAEDGTFFSHKGINYRAILRAALANLRAGKKAQGGSTITQQVARSLVLTTKKTYTRKLKEVILALRMEKYLSKQDILYIYLNQIYLGHGAYGLEMASRIYFRKSTRELSLAEASLLAGLPKAPSRFSPIHNPERAKARQVYVLNRMFNEKYITEQEFQRTLQEPIKVFVRKDFNNQSPYYLETARRILLNHFSQEELLTNGLKIQVAMDLEKQTFAQEALRKGLEERDRQQGYRGVLGRLADQEELGVFRNKLVKKLKRKIKTHLILPPYKGVMGQNEDEVEKIKDQLMEGEKKKQDTFPWDLHKDQLVGKIFKTYLHKVDKETMEVFTPFGLLTMELRDLIWTMPKASLENPQIEPSLKNVFKENDIIRVRILEETKLAEDGKEEKELSLELYQKPLVEGALLSLDLESSDILAIVGGYDYKRSQFNRAYQALRQSGSIFKPFVYGAALERGFHASSIIDDTPVVFSEEEADETKEEKVEDPLQQVQEEQVEKWKPSNISGRFSGDLLFRTALIRSLNVPTVKIIEKIGIKWTRFYARRLGIFSPLNPDFTMALGSSSLTLYELVRAFSVFPNLGKKVRPRLILQVQNRENEVLLENLTLDEVFYEQIEEQEKFIEIEKERWFTEKNETERGLKWREILQEDSDQLIPKTNSYVVTNLLSSVVQDSEGTGRRAQVLKRPVAGKTGTTDGYYDTWFMGFSRQISTGVWVGFDKEKTLGKRATGSSVSLPIWLDYMEKAHEDLPVMEFPIPEGIVFANIDAETGKVVSEKSRKVALQAFIEGTEPDSVKLKESDSYESENSHERAILQLEDTSSDEEEEDFIKDDLSE